MQELEQVEWTVTDLQLLLSENCQASLPAVSAHWSLDEAQESAHATALHSKIKRQMLLGIHFVQETAKRL